MEEKQTTTTEQTTEDTTQDNKETSDNSQTENSQAENELRMVNRILEHIDVKLASFAEKYDNKWLALADDIHQRLDKQDDSLSTTAAQLQNKREGVF